MNTNSNNLSKAIVPSSAMKTDFSVTVDSSEYSEDSVITTQQQRAALAKNILKSDESYVELQKKLFRYKIIPLSTRGTGYLVDGFVYVRDKERPGKVYLRCKSRTSCHARAMINTDLDLVKLTHEIHSHPPPDFRDLRLRKDTRPNEMRRSEKMNFRQENNQFRQSYNSVMQCFGRGISEYDSVELDEDQIKLENSLAVRAEVVVETGSSIVEGHTYRGDESSSSRTPNGGIKTSLATDSSIPSMTYVTVESQDSDSISQDIDPSRWLPHKHIYRAFHRTPRKRERGRDAVFPTNVSVNHIPLLECVSDINTKPSLDDYTGEEANQNNRIGGETNHNVKKAVKPDGYIRQMTNRDDCIGKEKIQNDFMMKEAEPTDCIGNHESVASRRLQTSARAVRRETCQSESGSTLKSSLLEEIEERNVVSDSEANIFENEDLKSSPDDSFDAVPKVWAAKKTFFQHKERYRRTRSINAPIPSPAFGPKACLKKVPPSQIMHVTDPSSQRLIWKETPLTVLVIKKMMDASILEPFKQLVTFLSQERNLAVYVEEKVLQDPELLEDEHFEHLRAKMKTFKDGSDIKDKIDFIVCLGGDGTLLYASSLFQDVTVPPVMAFHLGSFGFLTTYEFGEFKEGVDSLLKGNVPVTLRSRLKCMIFESDDIPNDVDVANSLTKQRKADPPNLKFKWQCLNEVVIDRGPSPYLSNLDLYLDDRHITTVQGDGIIISTPTGSTAYAAAAGASMIHPNVPAILITPICPHTLSFRPIVVPAGIELKVKVSEEARHTAWVSLDGKHRQEICKGWCLRITNSLHPVASVCSIDQIVDWFDSLVHCMHWNERELQKSFRRERKLLPNSKKSEQNNNTNGQ